MKTRIALLLALCTPLLASNASAQERVGYGKRLTRPSHSAALRAPGHARRAPSYRSGVRATPYGSSYRHGARTVLRRVWIPERVERVWVEPVFELRFDSCGNELRVLVREGYHEDVVRPGYWVTREVTVPWRTRATCKVVFR
jgi:hypothetical protein